MESTLITSLLLIVVILVSLSVHEAAHALVANLFGDPTAKLEGRLSLNPLRHWDNVGTTLLVGLLLLRMFGAPVPVFGWGKPVPINERNFDNPKSYSLQTAFAGPMSNLLLAILIAVVIRYLPLPPLMTTLLQFAVYLNVFLMFFNMIPIPPLDGSRILQYLLPGNLYHSLSANPLLFFGIFLLVIFFLLDFLALLSQQFTSYLLGFGA